ncbi:bifunctional nicotinamidase/pyrazinamidase [Acidipila sp. 4G-K13]|nr:bifunctional nicotinamidase/pyrazinamidase [Paracidobacterium acidisoli]
MQLTDQDVLLVVDVQNDFCPGGRLPVPHGDHVIEVIHRLAVRFAHIILTQDWHPPGHISFASSHPGKQPFESIQTGHSVQVLWPDHCVQGTSGADFPSTLHLPQAELILRKGFRPEIDSYSTFFENDHTTSTGLASYLRDRGFARVFCAGLAYDYCVGFSAVDARRAGFASVILPDACMAIDLNDSVASIEREFSRSGVSVAHSQSLVR